MDPNILRNISYGITVLGTALVLGGSIGSYYFGNLSEKVAPYKQLIRTATATVEVTIKSDKNINTLFADRGGGIELLKDNEHMIVMEDSQSIARQKGNGQVIFRGDFKMDAGDIAAGKPIMHLKDAEKAEIEFLKMERDAEVLGGNVICILNSSLRFEINIPAQKITNGKILIEKLDKAFEHFP